MILYETRFGSQVYGTNTPESDVDIGVVIMESPSLVFGIKEAKDFPQVQDDNNNDIRKFWLKRFIRLCVRGNPNVLEWMYTPIEHVISIDPVFDRVLAFKRRLLHYDSIVKSHLGFAKSQVMRMTKHDKTVGAKRRKFVEKYGYDVKYASHAIRLIYQLTDLLQHGRIVLPYEENVRLELMDIKQGKLTLPEFTKLYEARVNEVDKLIATVSDTVKMFKPDHGMIASLLEEVYREGWHVWDGSHN